MLVVRPPHETFAAVAEEARICRTILAPDLAAQWESVEAAFSVIAALLARRSPDLPGDESHIHLMFDLLSRGSPQKIGDDRVYERLLKAFKCAVAPREQWSVCALLWCDIQQRLLLYADQTPRPELIPSFDGKPPVLAVRQRLPGGELAVNATIISEQQAAGYESQREGALSVARTVGSELHGLLTAFVK